MNAVPRLKFYEEVSQKISIILILIIMNDQVHKATIQKMLCNYLDSRVLQKQWQNI